MTPLLFVVTLLGALVVLPPTWVAGQRIGEAIYRLPAGTSLAVRILTVGGSLVLCLGSAITHGVNYRAGTEFDIWLVLTYAGFLGFLTFTAACLARPERGNPTQG